MINIKNYNEVTFLPIEFFKTQKVITGNNKEEKLFTSSGTTGTEKSKHYITDIEIYKKSF